MSSSTSPQLDDILNELEKKFGASSGSTSSSSTPAPSALHSSKRKGRSFFAQPLVGFAVFALLLVGTGFGIYAGQQQTRVASQASEGQLAQLGGTRGAGGNCGTDNVCLSISATSCCEGYHAIDDDTCEGTLKRCIKTPPASCNNFNENSPFAPCANNGEVCDLSTIGPDLCVGNYRKWVCGNKQWIPDYTSKCDEACPWPVEPGQQCCPTGDDKCDLSQPYQYQCIEDPFLNECVKYHDACGNIGVKQAICFWPNTQPGKDACNAAAAAQDRSCGGGTTPSPTPPVTGPTPTPAPFCKITMAVRPSAAKNDNGRYLLYRNSKFQLQATISEIIGGPIRRVQFRVMGNNTPKITPTRRGVQGKTGNQIYRSNFIAREYGKASFNIRARLASQPTTFTCQGNVPVKFIPPVCVSLNLTPTNKGTRQVPFKPGDQVTLACRKAAGALRYEFRVIRPDGTIDMVRESTTNSRISAPYVIPAVSTATLNRFLAQCRVCDTTEPGTCTGVWSTDIAETCDEQGVCAQ